MKEYKDYYVKKNVNEQDERSAARLGSWSLIIGLFSIPALITIMPGIIISAISITLAVLSRYVGGRFNMRSRIGFILGVITMIIIFIMVYSYVHVMDNPAYYKELLEQFYQKQGS